MPDEIPKKNPILETRALYSTIDDASFSVERHYKSLKLGLRAPFYCGVKTNVSV